MYFLIKNYNDGSIHLDAIFGNRFTWQYLLLELMKEILSVLDQFWAIQSVHRQSNGLGHPCDHLAGNTIHAQSGGNDSPPIARRRDVQKAVLTPLREPRGPLAHSPIFSSAQREYKCQTGQRLYISTLLSIQNALSSTPYCHHWFSIVTQLDVYRLGYVGSTWSILPVSSHIGKRAVV